MDDVTNKLPEELRANYKIHTRKSSSIIEHLKVAAALKLWERGYKDIKFEVPVTFSGKTLIMKVLARNAEGGVVGVECASVIKLGRLRERVAQLRSCLPPNSWLIIIFPSSIDERVDKAAKLADEVWITGKNNTVEQILFITILHRSRKPYKKLLK